MTKRAAELAFVRESEESRLLHANGLLAQAPQQSFLHLYAASVKALAKTSVIAAKDEEEEVER
jgi:hypothetical protein